MRIEINGHAVPDPWDAVRIIVAELPTDKLGAELWMTLLRQIKRDRTEGMPEVCSQVAANAVLVKEPSV